MKKPIKPIRLFLGNWLYTKAFTAPLPRYWVGNTSYRYSDNDIRGLVSFFRTHNTYNRSFELDDLIETALDKTFEE